MRIGTCLVGTAATLIGAATLVAAPALMGRDARAGLTAIQSASFFPQWIAIGLALTGLGAVAAGLRPAPAVEDPDVAIPAAPLRLAAVAAALAAAPFAFRLIGMAPTLGLLMLCLGALFGCRGRSLLLLAFVAAALPAALDVGLRRLLYVLMPEGTVW